MCIFSDDRYTVQGIYAADKNARLSDNGIFLLSIDQMNQILKLKQKYIHTQDIKLYFHCVERFNAAELRQIHTIHDKLFLERYEICMVRVKCTRSVFLDIYINALRQQGFVVVSYQDGGIPQEDSHQ